MTQWNNENMTAPNVCLYCKAQIHPTITHHCTEAPGGYCATCDWKHEKMKAMSHNQRFELLAELFKADTGFVAPGKSVPRETALEQYEIDRQHAWHEWNDSKALAMALQFIQALRAERDEYEQLYAALETCDTNQIRQERDNLRLRIKAVDDEHAQLKIDREKMVQEYTILEVDRNLWRTQAEADAKERDFYKRMWAIRGTALEQPCLGCGYTGNQIRMKNGEIP